MMEAAPTRAFTQLPFGGGVPMLCLPYAGGGTRAYDSWSRLLPPNVAVVTARLPGRENRSAEPPATDAIALAASIADELAPQLPARFLLFGHSMGAVLAFEVARKLRAMTGREPDCLVVSGIPAPQFVAATTKYSLLSDADLRTQLEAMGGTDQEILRDRELWSLVMPMVRADLTLCDAYDYVRETGPTLTCPLVAYGSTDDHDLSDETVRGWQEHSTGKFEYRIFPGGHFYFQQWPEAFAMDLIRRLSPYIRG